MGFVPDTKGRPETGHVPCSPLTFLSGAGKLVHRQCRWPNITIKREPPPDAKDWEGKPDKTNLLSPNPGTGD